MLLCTNLFHEIRLTIIREENLAAKSYTNLNPKDADYGSIIHCLTESLGNKDICVRKPKQSNHNTDQHITNYSFHW